ncbi:phospholipase D-like domain-containing protein [Sphingopyxis sp. PET50]|uniref:phospholipase D-like domain-containing protein n=1 Tax=Sphingopyxis sp. PET50 TaxID=2976533 RepID=UPI0021AEDB9F|nr:phospholipase D-like domain-containing protein [Sphingopyxis sp. PET50]
MANDWLVRGRNSAALFKLALHRGEGMVLIGMDWKDGPPGDDFVGFSIEFRYPGGDRYWPVRNRIAFADRMLPRDPASAAPQYPSTEAPFQVFRWIHFPRVGDQPGKFAYRVTPMFMNESGVLARGEAQEAEIDLHSKTMPGALNIAFTRGYVSSQSFVDRFGGEAAFGGLIPKSADEGIGFVPTHPQAAEAYGWMGFEARAEILALLNSAITEGAAVAVVAYELNLPELVSLFVQMGPKLSIIIDDSSDKGEAHSAESVAAERLTAAGAQVRRQHMGNLQHNKMIVVDGPVTQAVVLGSTNFSWRGFYVQANNAVIVRGAAIVAQQMEAFHSYWPGSASGFTASASAAWRPLQIAGLDAEITMSPHKASNATLAAIGADIATAESSLFYSLAFLAQTGGAVRQAIETVTQDPDIFVYGMADKKLGLILVPPDGNPQPVAPSALTKNLPEPFRSEATGGFGVKMHHKFVVIDFDRPSARVYLGSFNFSKPADLSNGENLLVIRDRKIATAYMVEALRLFDSYQFRLSVAKASHSGEAKTLKKPPRLPGEVAWWAKFWDIPVRARDRKLFS